MIVEVYNTQTGEMNTYRSMREAARILKVSMYILTKYNGHTYKGLRITLRYQVIQRLYSNTDSNTDYLY